MRRKQIIFFSLMIMCIVMVLPFKVQAATVAKIGKKNYSTIEKAFASVSKGQTIKLMKNIKLPRSVTLYGVDRKVKFTLDLNKHTIECKMGQYLPETLNFSGGADVTIKNGTIKGIIKSEDSKLTVKNTTLKPISDDRFQYVIDIEDGKLVIEKAKVYGKINTEYTKTIVKSGTFKSEQNFYVFGGSLNIINATMKALGTNDEQGCMIAVDDGAKVTIHNGNFQSNVIGIQGDGSYRGKPKVEKVTVLGGTFKTKWQTFLYINALTIKGGNFKNTINRVEDFEISWPIIQGGDNKDNVIITGGTFTSVGNADVISLNNKGSLKISKATMNSNGSCVSMGSGSLTIKKDCKIHSNTSNAVYVEKGVSKNVSKSALSTDSSEYYAFGYPGHYMIGKDY